jgi:uncharacterized coiled-coil protein SlyX
MIDYKSKALKYKFKYLSLKSKNILVGGKINDAIKKELSKKGFTEEEITFLESIEMTNGIELSDDQMFEFFNKSKDGLLLDLPNITLETISNGGSALGINGIVYYNQCFYMSLVDILTNTGIAPGITVEKLREIGNLDPKPDDQMWDNEKFADRQAIEHICDYFNIELRIINSTSNKPRKVKYGNVLLDGCKIPLGSWIKGDKKPDKKPEIVYIAHMGMHFEAVKTIKIDSNRKYEYELKKIDGDISINIDTKPIKNNLQLSSNNGKSKKCSKNSKVSLVDDSSGGIHLTESIKEYYQASINGTLTEHQKELEKQIDKLNQINFKLNHYKSLNLVEKTEKILSSSLIENEQQLHSYLTVQDEYVKYKKLRDSILKLINEFK